jgi:type IV pilus assembly protein PilV
MKSPRSIQRGILLLEALIAILLISFGILGLIALWANSLKDVSEAKYRSDASFLANEMIGQLWLDRANIAPGYPVPTAWTTRIAATLPSGTGTILVEDNTDIDPLPVPPAPPALKATITVQWTLPGHVEHTFVSVAYINGSGPISRRFEQ